MFTNELWNKPPAGATDFYTHQIANSIRADTNNGYLHRTPSSAGNRATWTFSTWIKLAQMGTGTRIIYSAGSSGDQDGYYRLYYSSNELKTSSANANFLTPSNIFRDPSAWYHIVWKQGSNTSTLYVNGEQIATASVSGNTAVNNNTLQCIGTNSFGGSPTNGDHLDGYFAETIMIDGTALGPDSFGETKNGVWIPKDASGLTFGTNGFHLDYADSSALGNDVSGNNNDWTTVNLSAHDQMLDSPTFNSSSNGGNFATMNPLSQGSYATLSEGNLKVTGNTGADVGRAIGNIAPTTGKWYFEINMEDVYAYIPSTGLRDVNAGNMGNQTTGPMLSIGMEASGALLSYSSSGQQGNMGTVTSTSTGVSSFSDGDIMMIAWDCENRKMWIGKNGTFFNSGNPASGSNPQFSWTAGSGISAFTPQCGVATDGSDAIFNFGQDGTFAGTKTAQGNSDDTGYGNFYYDPPTGYLALCSGNLPLTDAINPAETDTGYPQKQFNALLYTGDGGSSRAITGLGFQPDWIWIKRRNATENHNMYDAVRGANKRIQPNRSVVESTEGLPAIGSDGFTVDASGGICNVSSQTYVAWNAKANGGGSSNSDGGTTSTVSANTDIGFSIVQYAGAGGTQTIGHGLDKAPEFMSCKPTAGYAYQWVAYHKNGNDGATGQNGYLAWETTGGFSSLSTIWNNTAPTSTVFTTGGSQNTGASGGTYINYCWHSVEGVTDVGMYIGNGSTDGAFVYTGFRPAFIIIKGLASGAGWNLHDNKTSPFNVASTALQSNTSSAELSNYNIDMVSNGFKIRDSDGDLGTNGNKYIYVAMAENPFKYATAR